MIRRPPRSTLFPYTLFRSMCKIWIAVSCPTMQFLTRYKRVADRKSTRLNSSHGYISYAVFCLKKKIINPDRECVPARRNPRAKVIDMGRGQTLVGAHNFSVEPNPRLPVRPFKRQHFFLMIRRPRKSTLFPYTTLFR